jgi:transmembrane sensor
VDIVFQPENMATRSLTVSLENESLYEKLEVICKTLGLTYQIVDAQIIIANQAKPQ